MRERDQGSKNPGLFLTEGRLKVVRLGRAQILIYGGRQDALNLDQSWGMNLNEYQNRGG